MNRIIQPFAKCWNEAPALLYGLAFLLGSVSALNWNPILLLPLFCLFSPLLLESSYHTPLVWQRLFLAAAGFIIALCYVNITIHFPDITTKQTDFQGIALFEISNFAMVKKHHGRYAIYKGTIKAFYVDGQEIAKNIPTSISLSDRLQLPPADRSYQIHGTLREIGPHTYRLIPNKDASWIPLKGSWSLAAIRHQMKQNVSQYIHRNIKNERSADFLSGIATGDFDDRMISKELGRFGLQHIMAISGFHFTIVATILGLLLRLIIPKRYAVLLLIGLITTYFLFLGCGPSILRAWFTTLLALLSFFIERKSMALNTLGLALLFVLAFDPTLCENLGFQFSFASTAAILILYSPCDALLQKVFPVRKLSTTSKMGSLTQHAYCLLCFCREASALGVAVNLAALPLTLFYFNKFPFLGLIYNLFFPVMVSAAMLLMILGIIASIVVPPLAGFLHATNSEFTRFMLNYAYNIPSSFDLLWRTSDIPIEMIVFQFSFLFAIGLYYKDHCERNQLIVDDWSFL